jgi:hypothetical protein
VRRKAAGSSVYDGALGDNTVAILIAPTQAAAEALRAELQP